MCIRDRAKPDDVSEAAVQSVVAHFKGVDAKELGLCFDTLYELATPLAVACARHGFSNVNLAAPHIWRYAKSVFKRSLLRGDAETFGWLQHRIDRLSKTSHGTTAVVKSGLDGQQRSTHIFQRATQGYVRRLAWRQLVQYARHRPSQYPWLAAHALAAYGPEDRGNHKGAYDVWARAYVFHRVLRGESKRFDFMARTLSFRTKYVTKGQAQVPEGRVESFPELWDAAPGAYVPLLARSKASSSPTASFRLRSASTPERRRERSLRAASARQSGTAFASPRRPSASTMEGRSVPCCSAVMRRGETAAGSPSQPRRAAAWARTLGLPAMRACVRAVTPARTKPSARRSSRTEAWRSASSPSG